jgi:uncharacterized protein (DUF3820 family)
MSVLDYYQGVTLDLDTELEFGKYKGLTVDEVIDDDAEYIEWLIDRGIDTSDEVKELLQ